MIHRKDMDKKVKLLQGQRRLWWDEEERRMVTTITLYIPYGCPDWGICIFCSVHLSVKGYRQQFYNGAEISVRDQIELFRETIKQAASEEFHTLMIFNAGSFLAMPLEIQQAIFQEIILFPSIQRVVVESRAELITTQSLERLLHILKPTDKRLTIRVGVETQDDYLRLRVLRKGHTRKQLFGAIKVMRDLGITSGGYALLNPAPDLNEMWAIQEAQDTVDWVLDKGTDQLGMEECYFCSTNVGPASLLFQAWKQGQFKPATLWAVFKVMQYGLTKYGTRLHLLPFKDEPELLAVPSNHIVRGIPQDLSGAVGCDFSFHAMFDTYRQTMNPAVLVPPQCSCKPEWF